MQKKTVCLWMFQCLIIEKYILQSSANDKSNNNNINNDVPIIYLRIITRGYTAHHELSELRVSVFTNRFICISVTAQKYDLILLKSDITCNIDYL